MQVEENVFGPCDGVLYPCELLPTDLAAVAEAHVAERRQFGVQTGRLVELLPHAARLPDGLHHRVLVPKQRRGLQAGQNVCNKITPW